MNDPALKGGVSRDSRRLKRRLLGKKPAMVAVIDVSLDYISGDVPDTAEKFARTPKMAFTKMATQPRMLAKKLVGASALQQLKGFGNAHSRRQTSKHMNMVRLNLELKNFNFMGFRNFTQKLLTMFANYLKLKGVFGIFRLPHKVESILSNAVLVMCKSLHFMFPPRFFCRADANSKAGVSAPDSAAHSFSINYFRNSLRRLGTSG